MKNDTPRNTQAVQQAATELRAVLEEAACIFDERGKARGNLFKRHGWRGCLYDLRVCAERAWAVLWHYTPPPLPEVGNEVDEPDPVDELLDCINYAAMAIMEVRAGNRDGVGGWWQ